MLFLIPSDYTPDRRSQLCHKYRQVTPIKSSPTKRKAKATGKRTGGRPAQKHQITRTDDVLEKKTANTQPEKTESSHSDDSRSTTSSQDVVPSPKRQKQKSTPAKALATQRKSTRNRQSALINAFGNAVPINTINENDNEKKRGTKRISF